MPTYNAKTIKLRKGPHIAGCTLYCSIDYLDTSLWSHGVRNTEVPLYTQGVLFQKLSVLWVQRGLEMLKNGQKWLMSSRAAITFQLFYISKLRLSACFRREICADFALRGMTCLQLRVWRYPLCRSLCTISLYREWHLRGMIWDHGLLSTLWRFL